MRAWREWGRARWAASPFGRIGRNYTLGVVNGWLTALGDAFYNPTIVLATFAALLGAPGPVVGLLPALVLSGWLIPQGFLAPWVARLPQKIVLYRGVALFRLLGLVTVTLATFLLGGNPQLLLGIFLVGLTLNALANGVSGLPFMEVVSKTIPARERAPFFGTRNLGGGFLGLLAGLAVAQYLELPFPMGYGLAFGSGLLAYGLGWFLFGLVHEPAEVIKAEKVPILLPLRDPLFRRAVLARAVLSLGGMVEPFYAAYAVKTFAVSGATGNYLTVYLLAFTVSNLLWIRVAMRYGSRALLAVAGLSAALVPWLALNASATWFMLVFLLQGAYYAAMFMGTQNYALSIAPSEYRSAYIGLFNTILGITSFAPVLGGFVVEAWGYPVLFGLASVFYVVGFVLVRRLPLPG